MPLLRIGLVRNQLLGLGDQAVLTFSKHPRQSHRLLCQCWQHGLDKELFFAGEPRPGG